VLVSGKKSIWANGERVGSFSFSSSMWLELSVMIHWSEFQWNFFLWWSSFCAHNDTSCNIMQKFLHACIFHRFLLFGRWIIILNVSESACLWECGWNFEGCGQKRKLRRGKSFLQALETKASFVCGSKHLSFTALSLSLTIVVVVFVPFIHNPSAIKFIYNSLTSNISFERVSFP
jgi:hypothetical protein